MKERIYTTRRSVHHAFHRKKGETLLDRLDVEMTERCNNDCIHCYINLPSNDVTAKKRELPTREIQGYLNEAATLGCLTVRFTGGEPLLRKDFEKLYIFARRLGLKVLLFTNATLITPHLADLFARIPPLEKIEITVFGMTQKTYESVTRTPGSFETAWRGINLLYEKKVPFVVKGVLLPQNKDDIEAFEAWAARIPWMDTPPTYSMLFNLRGRPGSEAKNIRIRKNRPSPEEGLHMLTRNKEEYLKKTAEFCSKFMAPQGNNLFSCGAGAGTGCVDAYGTFQPCMLLRRPGTVYDLKKGSLKEAMTHFFPKVREMQATDPTYLARCARCFLMGLCEQCPAKSWMEHGTMDKPVDYYCDMAHAQARYLGLLEKDQMAWEVKDWKEKIRSLNRQKAPNDGQTVAERGGNV